jgi:hypothetical protein
MASFYADHKHIRFFADQGPEGWTVALYNLNARTWIDEGGWKHLTAQEAQEDAEEKAERFFGQPVKLEWIEGGPTLVG